MVFSRRHDHDADEDERHVTIGRPELDEGQETSMSETHYIPVSNHDVVLRRFLGPGDPRPMRWIGGRRS
jgi:hypothetical protein